MNENDILKGRLKDLANAAFRQNRYTYTNFLSAADMEVFYSNLEQDIPSLEAGNPATAL